MLVIAVMVGEKEVLGGRFSREVLLEGVCIRERAIGRKYHGMLLITNKPDH